MRISPEIIAPHARNVRTRYLESAIEQANLLTPWVRMVPLTTSTMLLTGKPSLANDSPMLIPFRQLKSDYVKSLPFMLSIADDWTIDLGSTTIDLDTHVGGIVDGIALQPASEYLLWAFCDDYRNFKGFGLTVRPGSTGVATSSGGGLGASGTFTVTAGYGGRFTIGARVLIRISTARGARYNQGVITGTSSGAFTADMDAAYTELDAEANWSLAAQTGMTAIQLDHFQPRMFNQDSLYPGSGTEYQYTYIGSIHSDDGSNIRIVRQRGDPVIFPALWYQVYSQTATSGGGAVNQRVCLARWVPLGTRHITGVIAAIRNTGTNVNGYSSVRTDSGSSAAGFTSNTSTAGVTERQTFALLLRLHNASAYFYTYTSAGSDVAGSAYLTSYEDEQF